MYFIIRDIRDYKDLKGEIKNHALRPIMFYTLFFNLNEVLHLNTLYIKLLERSIICEFSYIFLLVLHYE